MNRSAIKENLGDDVARIKELREQGKSYWDIAKELGKSYTWVYLRATGKYAEGTKSFQRDVVIPWIEQQEHMIVSRNTNTSYYQMNAYIDILSRKEGVFYLWQVKTGFSWKTLQEGLGELIVHKWGWRGKMEEVKLILVFPESERMKVKAPKELLEWISEKEGISIEFINDREEVRNEN